MRLSKISIKNFRGIRELNFDLHDYSTLIGANNTGKSSILKAIQHFLNQEKFIKDDWHEENFETDIEIEGVFDDIQDWERSIPGVAGIIQDDKIQLRVRSAYDSTSSKPSTPLYEAFFSPELIEGFDDKWSDLSSELKVLAVNEFTATGNWWRNASNKESFKSYLRREHPAMITRGQGQWGRENISIDAALKQALPQAILIPASVDFVSEMKTTSKTPFGQLLEIIIMPAIKATNEFRIFEESVTNLATRISRSVQGEDGTNDEILDISTRISERISSIIDNIGIILTMNPPEIEKIVSGGASIRVNDGIETPLEYQGHGTQRSLIFALIETIAERKSVRVENNQHKRPIMLLFEEPELYLHPHLMRRLKEALSGIAQSVQWQVLTSTHSPFLINVSEEPKSLIILKKNDSRVITLEQIIDDIYATELFEGERERLRAFLNFHPSVCEAFFARNVVLVEGDTEVAIFSLSSLASAKYNLDQSIVDLTTVISCDGKWTIPAFAKILSRLGIKFKIIHDRDAKGRAESDLAALTGFDAYCANAKILEAAGNNNLIHVVDDTFENIIWPGQEVASKDKPFRAWRKVRDLLTDTDNDEAALRDIFRFAFSAHDPTDQ